ncbi:MAG TPA: glucokinase [Vicinamibacterales bacterium]|nr:glucokinase [Vicinamibacterales bacterium]
MLLAGDVGGTKTLIGLFDQLPVRPRAISVRSYVTLEHPSLEAILDSFFKEEALTTPVKCACFGVAGPVADHSATLTNVPWRVNGKALARHHHIGKVAVLNDLTSMAYGILLLEESEIHVLQEGTPRPNGNMALIAAGTGLGECMLHFVDGDFHPTSSESGHADFAARSELDIAVLRRLTSRQGRASVEDVLSGRGIVHLHAVSHEGPCPALPDPDVPNAAATITAAALERRCHGCVSALAAFVSAYGAEAGNLALRTMATGGVFVGGGIAPKILPAMTDGTFVDAFRRKSPFEALLERIPVKVILNENLGLLGAASYAARLFAGRGDGVSG